MPDLTNRMEWVLRLDDEDFLLVLKCLGGRIGTVDERAAAEHLGDRLTELKANRLAFNAEQAEALRKALTDKGYERPMIRARRERLAVAGDTARLEEAPNAQ